MALAAFQTSVRRHGVLRSLVRAAHGRLRRVLDFEVCRVECNTGEPYLWPDVLEYETRTVGCDEFHGSLCPELADVDYRWAFARGDECTASFHGSLVVGYTFHSSRPTRVREGVDFFFSNEFVYSYASMTAPSHRGRRLEQDRWKAARRGRVASMGRDARVIWYVNVSNLESRAANRAVKLKNPLLGYAIWMQVGSRCRVFNSPGCRRMGTGFAAVPPK